MTLWHNLLQLLPPNVFYDKKVRDMEDAIVEKEVAMHLQRIGIAQPISPVAELLIPHPSIELTSDIAYLRCRGIDTPLKFDWRNYPDAFAMYMNFLQPDNLQVARLRLVEP